MTALPELPLPNPPFVLTLTRVVVPFTTSRTKTSLALLVSPLTKSPALLSKTAYWPLLEIPVANGSPLPPPTGQVHADQGSRPIRAVA